MAVASMGHQARMSFAAAGTAIGSFTEAIEFVGESLQKRATIADTNGIRGTRSVPVERARDANNIVGGTIRFVASPLLLDLMLPRILGAAEIADAFALAETLPEFDVLIDRVAKRFIYRGCKVNRATFRFSAGGFLELDVDVIGKSEDAPVDTAFPSITAPVDAPWLWSDSTGGLSIASSIEECMSGQLVIDNSVNARFVNSVNATDIHTQDRIVTLSLVTPYTSDEVAHYNVGAVGEAVTLTFTKGNTSLVFTMPKVSFADQSPTVNSKGELVLQLEGRARKSSTTPELAVTNDSSV